MLLRFLRLLTPRERTIAAVLFVAMVGGALLETAGLGLVLPFLAILNDPERAVSNNLMRRFASVVGAQSTHEILTALGLALLAFFILKNVYLMVLNWAQFRFLYGRQVRFATTLLRTYLSQPYEFFLETNSSLLIRKLNVDVFHAFSQAIIPLATVIVETLVAACVLGLLLYAAPSVALMTFAVLGGLGGAYYAVTRKMLLRLGRLSKHTGDLMIQWSSQALGSIKEAKVLGRETFFVDSFARQAQAHMRASGAAQVLANTPRMLIETLAVATLLAVAARALAGGSEQVLLTLGVFGLAAVRLMPSANRIAFSMSIVRNGAPSFDALFEDLYGLRPPTKPPDSPAVTSFGEISLSNLVYRYPNSAAPALDGVTLSIRSGQRVALVGHSGSGKTTLADVLLGLLRPSGGEIRIDGLPVSNSAVWRRIVGYVPQSVYLIDDSIRRNVALGLPDEAISDDDIWSALRTAHLDEFVAALPAKLDALVGENGVRLSGGQRQRIGIARAIYDDPQLIVLDEATSALDGLTEQEVRSSIESLSRTKTLVVIAHRMSTVRSCDAIFFLKAGRLIGADTFDRLVATNMEFRRFATVETD